jgi:hypothetical protein
MHISGNQKVFAIEWSIDSYIDPYYYGHLCFCINDKKVGNFDEITTISISVNYLNDFLNQSARVYNDSHTLSKEELFYRIHDVFFDSSGSEKYLNKNELYTQLHEHRDVFWLDDVGEYSFMDKIGMILINEPLFKRQRLIWKDLRANDINESYIPDQYFDMIAGEFLKEFEKAKSDLS